MGSTGAFRAANVIIALSALALFVLLATAVPGDTVEPDRSDCGSMVSVLRDGPDLGGEPRVDQASFLTSCVEHAEQRRTYVAVLAALVVGLGSFEFVLRRGELAARRKRIRVVRPFRD